MGGFDSSSAPEPLSILGLSQGKQETDQFEVFPCPTRALDGDYVFQFFIRGLRYMGVNSKERVLILLEDERLAAMSDFQNSTDPKAVMLRTETDKINIGYIPRYLTTDFQKLIETCDPNYIRVLVKKINLRAPPQYKVLCEFRACWPDSYEPFTSPDFKALPDGVTKYCGH